MEVPDPKQAPEQANDPLGAASLEESDIALLLPAEQKKSFPWKFLLLGLVLCLAFVTTISAGHADAASWILFGDEEDESDIYYDAKKPAVEPPIRILYVLTSSSSNKGGNDRIREILIPVLRDGVGSYFEKKGMSSNQKNYHVDVFMIASYKLSDDHRQAIRTALPQSVGFQVWDDAMPMDYVECNRNLDNTPFEEWNSTLCRDKPIGEISGVKVALSRQHRYVMKDKMDKYDIFISLEDDMRVMKHHVETHLRTMGHIRSHVPRPDSKLTKKMLKRVRPGFVRVESLQDINSERRVRSVTKSSREISKSIPLSKSARPIDTSWCCGDDNGPNATTPDPKSIIAWETAIESLGVIQIGDKWYVVIPGTREHPLPDYWAGSGIPNAERPDPFDAQFLAQPAFWIMTQAELMQAHTELCQGSFFPPFDAPTFGRNGLYRNNVEFWSGGIQMWCGSCNIVRIMELDRFSYHMVYHTTNNKQYDIHDPERLVRMNELHAQLWSVVKAAKTNN